MPLKFLIQPNVSDKEIHICYDYYCPPTSQHTTLLEHVIWVCEQHQISPNELVTTLKKFKIYDTTIACQKCQILKKVTEPNLNSTICLKKSVYICESCYEFLTSSF